MLDLMPQNELMNTIFIPKRRFESDDSWFYQNELNVDKMNEACKILFNHIDFECFQKFIPM